MTSAPELRSEAAGRDGRAGRRSPGRIAPAAAPAASETSGRRRAVTSAAAALALLALAAASGAQDAPPLRARFDAPPDALSVGDHATLVLSVDAAPSARQPFLVTPSSDGPAVEVVHGRLFRTDAIDPDASPLRFRIPIVAAGVGDAVVRARIDGYDCDGDRCEPATAEAEVALRIGR